MNTLRLFCRMILLLSFILNAESCLYSQLIEKKEFRLKVHNNSLSYESKLQKPVKPFTIRQHKKSMLLAAGLSFIVPGAALGQFYKEEYINGGIRLGISGICFLWFMLSPTFSITGDGPSSDQKIYAMALFAANWIASIVDAAITTKPTYNKYRRYYHSF